MSLFRELKRRNVFRVGMAYVVTSWLLLQLTEVLMDILELPATVGKIILLLLLIGFIPALLLAWAFELTPDGIRREVDLAEIPEDEKQATPGAHRIMDRSIIAMLVIALAYFVWESRFSSTEDALLPALPETPDIEEIRDGEDKIGLAVLPFVNMSPDTKNAHVSDGISEELINILVQVERLRVSSRTSSFSFRGSEKTLEEIGDELKVDYILEGSVRRDGNRIRVSSQLADVDTDTYLWSDTFTRELDDLFAVQDELATSIVNALRITMSGATMEELLSKGTQDIDAYELFLEGRHLWHQRTAESLLASIDLLEQAVELDPSFYRAWAALADSYILVPEYKSVDTESFLQPGREANRRALELKPNSARAIATRAYIHYFFDFNWTAAEEDFLRAIEINPDYATARQWYSEMLATQRRFDESIAQARRAVELDPHSAVARMVLGLNLKSSGQFDEGYAYQKQALEIGPGMPNLVRHLMQSEMVRGSYREARHYANLRAELSGWPVAPELPIIEALEDPALRADALDYLRTTTFPIDGVQYRPFYASLLGDRELTLDLLEWSFEQQDARRSSINKISRFQDLREEPRFIELLRQVNLSP